MRGGDGRQTTNAIAQTAPHARGAAAAAGRQTGRSGPAGRCHALIGDALGAGTEEGWPREGNEARGTWPPAAASGDGLERCKDRAAGPANATSARSTPEGTGGGRPSKVRCAAATNPAVHLQLETAVGDRGRQHDPVLLPSVQRLDQGAAERGVPESTLGDPRPQDPDHLESPAGAPLEARQEVRRGDKGRDRTRVSATVRSRAQSCRVHLGVPEVARDAGLLRPRLRPPASPIYASLNQQIEAFG